MTIGQRIEQIKNTVKTERWVRVTDDCMVQDFYLSDIQNALYGIAEFVLEATLDKPLKSEEQYISCGCKVICLRYE